MTKKTSDEKLAEELLAAGIDPDADTSTVLGGPKTQVTFAEALAESGQTVAELTGEQKKVSKRAAKKNDGEAPTVTTPRVRIAPGSTPSQVLAQHINDEAALHAASVLEVGDKPSADNFASVAGVIDKLAKKVGEKAVNVIRNRMTPQGFQVYTKIGMEQLLKTGTMSSLDLTKHLNETKYTIGTARAQSNQIMTLFPALKIATVSSKGQLTVNENSTIVRDYRAAIKN